MASKGKKFKNDNIFSSLKYGFLGIKYAFTKEKNIIFGGILFLLVIILGFVFKISQIEWIICIMSFGIVIALEMVNTAIENAVDIAMPNVHPMAKIAKDVSAGAVVFFFFISVINGLIILVPKIIDLF